MGVIIDSTYRVHCQKVCYGQYPAVKNSPELVLILHLLIKFSLPFCTHTKVHSARRFSCLIYDMHCFLLELVIIISGENKYFCEK